MTNANCVLIGQTFRGSANSSYTTGSSYAGQGGNGQYYDHRLKFETPAFTGIPKSITFNFSARSSDYSFIVLHYALCVSDKNVSKYQNHHKNVTDDPYQIASGVVRCDGLKLNTAHSITINASDISETLKPSTTYYLIMWSYQNPSEGIYNALATINPISEQSAILSYDDGLVYLDTGSKFEPFQLYIDNGEKWELCLPYIDNGINWDQCV